MWWPPGMARWSWPRSLLGSVRLIHETKWIKYHSQDMLPSCPDPDAKMVKTWRIFGLERRIIRGEFFGALKQVGTWNRDAECVSMSFYTWTRIRFFILVDPEQNIFNQIFFISFNFQVGRTRIWIWDYGFFWIRILKNHMHTLPGLSWNDLDAVSSQNSATLPFSPLDTQQTPPPPVLCQPTRLQWMNPSLFDCQ